MERKERSSNKHDRTRSSSPHRHSRQRSVSPQRHNGEEINANGRNTGRRNSQRQRSPVGRDSQRRDDRDRNLTQRPPICRDNEEDEIEKPNYSTSGALQNALLTYKGVLLKYSEPPESRKPTQKYRLYVFKKETQTDMYIISNQSCYLIGKDKKVCDIILKHPSISGQHCCLQYRLVGEEVKLYLIDLKSSNGTLINKKKVESERYYELLVNDLISFGGSERDYVLIKE